MPRTAYLDANVYDDIEGKAASAPSDVVEAVRAAKKRGALTIRLGIRDPALALRRLAIMRDLAGFDSLLNQPADVLETSIRAYATGTFRPPSCCHWRSGCSSPIESPRR